MVRRYADGSGGVAGVLQEGGRMSDVPASPPGGGGSGDGGDFGSVREQDRFLPIANIGSIMKKAILANGKIAKDAKETLRECISEFIASSPASECLC